MELEIRKLTPDLAEDYARFFDTTPHNDEGDGVKCYCVTWRNDDTYVGNDHWYPTEAERRARAIGFAKSGSIQGYLAYQGDKIVGWCNATGDCHLGINYLRAFWPIEDDRKNIRVKSIFCFMIEPNVQRQGVATQLTERICKDAAADGFDFVEAYVNQEFKEFQEIGHDFRGPLAMYEKCGFYQCAERDGRVVVRKALKKYVKKRYDSSG